MESIVKVGRLWADNKIYRAGDVIDLTEDQITQFGMSVERVVSVTAEIDVRDAEIAALNEKVAELENTIKLVSEEKEVVASQVVDEKKTPIKRGRK